LVAFLSGRPKPDEEPAEPEKRKRRRIDEDEEDKEIEQVWLINPFGGEPWPLTEGKRSVRAFEWAGRDSLLFTAQEERSLYEIEKKEKKDTSVVVEDEPHEPPVRLFRITVEDKKVTRVTDNEDRITAFWVAPDGRRVVTVHERSLRYTYDNKIKPGVFLYDLEKGDRRQLFQETKFNIHQVVWARDGNSFYAANQSTTHPQYVMATVMELFHHDIAAQRTVKVDLDWDAVWPRSSAGQLSAGAARRTMVSCPAGRRPGSVRAIPPRWRGWKRGGSPATTCFAQDLRRWRGHGSHPQPLRAGGSATTAKRCSTPPRLRAGRRSGIAAGSKTTASPALAASRTATST
jgi:dipeptidyl aminopeptidase/acylaminoacyl peptidase